MLCGGFCGFSMPVCMCMCVATGVEVEIEVEVLFVCGELWPAICAHNLLLLRRIKMKKENNWQSAWEGEEQGVGAERCEGNRRNGQWAMGPRQWQRQKNTRKCRVLPGCGYWFSVRQSQAAHHDDDDDATATDDDDAALAIFLSVEGGGR